MENMSPSNAVDSIQRYSRYLREGHKVGHALKRLSEIEVTSELLEKADLIEAVRQQENNKKHGNDAMKLLAKWSVFTRKECSALKERTPEEKENRKRASDLSDENDSKKSKLDRSSPPLKLVIKRSSLSPELHSDVQKSPEPLDPKSLLEKVKSGLAGINRAPTAEKPRGPVKKGVLMMKTMRMCGRAQTKKRGINV